MEEANPSYPAFGKSGNTVMGQQTISRLRSSFPAVQISDFVRYLRRCNLTIRPSAAGRSFTTTTLARRKKLKSVALAHV